jgi:hypothetical protein
MKINNSSDFDLDLFFNLDAFFVHVATAGLQIRDEIFFNTYHNDFRNFIKNFSRTPFQYKLNPSLEKIISFKREINPNFDFKLYTDDFIEYAKLGLFSFDRTYIERNNDYNFHLVAYPIFDSGYNDIIEKFSKVEINRDFDYDKLNYFIDLHIERHYNRSDEFFHKISI